MSKRNLDKTITKSNSLAVFPVGAEAEAVILEGEKATLKYEYCLKPGIDRVFLTGFSALSYETFFDLGFSLNVMQSKDQFMLFDIESMSYTKDNGVGKINIIGKRHFETFLDEQYGYSVPETSLEKAITLILEGYDVSFNIPNKKDIKVTISPHPNRTRREIVSSLCKQYDLLWCSSIFNDNQIFVFESELSMKDISPYPLDFNSASLIISPIGFFSGEQSCFIQPGTRMEIEGGFSVACAIMTMTIRGQGSSEIDFDFMNTTKFKCFTEEELKKCKSIQRRMVTYLDKPKDPFYMALVTKETDGLLDGTYVNMKTQFDIVGNDDQGSAVGGIIQSSPWATIDGSGMSFPYNLSKRETMVASPTDTRSVAIADIANSVDNGSGKKFVINFESTDGSKAGSLEFNTEDGKWTITGEGIILGAGANKGLALADHKHSTSALVVASLNTPSTVTGGLGASDSNTSIVKAK